jgi:23S rRNA (guanosine2251-2'-O)-methyltransferase
MTAASFEFRVCQNPDCGLRYPLLEGSEFGERCPICLGATRVVVRAAAEREAAARSGAHAPTSGPAALLDNIRSAWNVGSIFRSAEGFGFSHLYLCGITPTPENEQVRKTALGAQEAVSWSSHRNAVVLAAELKARGCTIWSLERTDGSQSMQAALRDQDSRQNMLLVVGNEQAGVDPGLLQLSERIVHIEMSGAKRSFNVAVAFAVAAHVLKQD